VPDVGLSAASSPASSTTNVVIREKLSLNTTNIITNGTIPQSSIRQ
jgi:hypothetical protein